MIWIIAYCIGMYVIAGMGVAIGYHRLLCHKCADVSRWFEYCLVIFGLPAGTPVQWVGNHRAHHKFADKEGDPHSPVLEGFWYAHCGWYIQSSNPMLCMIYALAGPGRMFLDSFMRPRSNQEHIIYAKDISQIKFYAWLSNPWNYMIIMWIYLIVVIGVPLWLFGLNGALMAGITLVFIYNVSDAVDSFGHLIGKKTGKSGARNNVVLGWISFGDGWHSNHQQHPRSARLGTKKGQFDLAYMFLLGLKRIGLVKKLY